MNEIKDTTDNKEVVTVLAKIDQPLSLCDTLIQHAYNSTPKQTAFSICNKRTGNSRIARTFILQ